MFRNTDVVNVADNNAYAIWSTENPQPTVSADIPTELAEKQDDDVAKLQSDM